MIAPDGAVQIVIGFSSFSTQENSDIVRVFQCTSLDCADAQQLAELSGAYSSTQVIIARTGYMKVKFTTDASITKAGFKASWNSV
jgi:hypothetical protein